MIDVFTYFQEANGDTVEYFWRRLKEENLDSKRVTKLELILKRARIKNQEEYDFVTDTIVPFEQDVQSIFETSILPEYVLFVCSEPRSCFL